MAGPAYSWELPDGIAEMLPARAACFEQLRRETLDRFHSWGYALVIPPLLEYADTPYAGAERDLRDLSFQFTDQLSGRPLAVRADITPQTARIDARSLHLDGPVRLCYAGDVLHTRPRRPLARRQPFPAGAELYGSDELAADLEIVALMLETVRSAQCGPLCLDLGHVSIYRALAADAGLEQEAAAALFDVLQRKAADEIPAALPAGLGAAHAERLSALGQLHGDRKILEEARRRLAGAPAAVGAALDALTAAAERFAPEAQLYFDCGELRGYRYHTGMVFSACAPGQGEPLADGGRCDGIGAAFGRIRPAVGFSTDLARLADLRKVPPPPPSGIFAAAAGPGLTEEIARLRAAGERVVYGLQGQSEDASCDRRLVRQSGQWRVESAHS